MLNLIKCLNLLPGNEFTLLSIDREESANPNAMGLSIDLLNILNKGSLLPHELKLNIGVPDVRLGRGTFPPFFYSK